MKGRRNFLKTSAGGAGAFLLDLRFGDLFVEEFAQPTPQPGSPYGDMFVMESAPGAETVINGRTYVYFGGTGYFGLHGHPELIKAGVEAYHKYGTHSGTTRSGFGNNPVLLDVERRLADYFGTEDAVYFVSGYFANLVLAQGLAAAYDVIFIDETAHFSVRDGAATAGKPVHTFRHRDPNDLAVRLKKILRPKERPFLLTDGVFPTFGLIAPVPDYVRVLAPYGGLIGLDDSHSVGVLGANGRGTYEHFGQRGENLYFAGTLSKAFGGHGGFLPASRALIQFVRQNLGVYSGSSPTPTPVAASSAKGLELVKAHPEWREALRRNTALVKQGLRGLGFETNDSPVPIATFTLKSAEQMKKVQKALMDRGVAVAYLKYVGAPSGGVLRATIFSTHTEAHIQKLLDELKRVV
ncbi:MAG: pyridoxal phosphate-dependent aminotransferase family protein [Candidatus Aminicenantes bacterium]|nr:pyridoxal phosphate-dependent aminotransferase family protein [Candidatus Aminicenantes bacterium]